MRTKCGTFLAGFAAVAAQVAMASPAVTAVNMSQPAKAGQVTITYTLADAPAVVTLDVETNVVVNGETVGWASIGGEHIWNAQGDVWKKVGSSGSFNGTITWRPDKSWKDENGNGFKVDGTTYKARAVVTAWPLYNTPDYMVVDITEGTPHTQDARCRYYPAAEFVPGGVTSNADYKADCILMRKIMANGVTWTMGSVSESGRNAANEATHRVTLTNNYYIGVFEITQGQADRIWPTPTSGTDDSGFVHDGFAGKGSDRAANKITFNKIRMSSAVEDEEFETGDWPTPPNANSWLGRLNTRTGMDFDLPTEAQWEFACRAGHGEGKLGDGSDITTNNLSNVAFWTYNTEADRAATGHTDNYATTVGRYEPNSWGLYDMHGNVSEWVLDWYKPDIGGENGAFVNRAAATAAGWGKRRVYRGGTSIISARSAYKTYISPAGRSNWTGFRVVCRAGL